MYLFAMYLLCLTDGECKCECSVEIEKLKKISMETSDQLNQLMLILKEYKEPNPHVDGKKETVTECDYDNRYENLLNSNLSTPDERCILFDEKKAIILWHYGCPPCMVEFRDIVFPAMKEDPSLRKSVITAFVIDNFEKDAKSILAAQSVIEKLGEFRYADHIIVVKGQGKLGRYLKEKDLAYPSFIFFDGQKMHYFNPDSSKIILDGIHVKDYLKALKLIVNKELYQ